MSGSRVPGRLASPISPVVTEARDRAFQFAAARANVPSPRSQGSPKGHRTVKLGRRGPRLVLARRKLGSKAGMPRGSPDAAVCSNAQRQTPAGRFSWTAANTVCGQRSSERAGVRWSPRSSAMEAPAVTAQVSPVGSAACGETGSWDLNREASVGETQRRLSCFLASPSSVRMQPVAPILTTKVPS